MKRLPDAVRIEITRLLIAGFGYMKIHRATGADNKTIKPIRDGLMESGELPTKCPCGRGFGHSGTCEYRRKLSPPPICPRSPYQLQGANRYQSGRLKRTK